MSPTRTSTPAKSFAPSSPALRPGLPLETAPASDPWLKTYGGMFFAMVNATGSYLSDMSAVVWGTVTLASGGDTSTIFYTDFASGTGDYRATSQSLAPSTAVR
jgi:hypothetical protein